MHSYDGPTGSSAITTWPGLNPAPLTLEYSTSQKEKVELWFIEPLNRMSEHEGFICLMVCFPLIETIIRFELQIPPTKEVAFSDNSPALHWFARFMQIRDTQAREVWDAFRNGLLHSAMVKSSLPYQIVGGKHGRPAEHIGDTVWIHVWDLRDAVVEKLRQHHSKLWRELDTSLAKIYRRS